MKNEKGFDAGREKSYKYFNTPAKPLSSPRGKMMRNHGGFYFG